MNAALLISEGGEWVYEDWSQIDDNLNMSDCLSPSQPLTQRRRLSA